MIGGRYKAYPEYRNTDESWIGQIPSHWKSSNLGFTCSVKARLGWKGLKAEEYVDEGFVFLATPNIKGDSIDFQNVNRITERRYLESPEIMLEEGDVLVTKDGSTTGTTNLVRNLPEPATVNSSIAILRSLGEVSPPYLYYFFTSDFTQNVIDLMRGGMGVPHLFQADLRKFFQLLPPNPEQIQIARFLDHETGKIDLLIEKQQELIALLKEKRQAVISHAVTKGLNPQAPLKDSGIEWLGQVPEHWEVPRLKFFLIGIDQGKSPECEARLADDGEWGVLKSGCVNHGIYDQDEHKALPARIPPATSSEVFEGDLLMSRANGSRDLIGSVAYVSQTRSKLLLSDKIFRLKPIQLNRAEFIWKALGARPSREQIELSINGAEGLANNITKESIKNLSVALPPTEEQEAIAKFLSTKVGKIDSTIKAAETQITLLQERRTALISAAVTGKIDVRDWKPLPEETT